MIGYSAAGEGQQIASCLSSLDSRIAAEADNLAAVNAGKKSLIAAFVPGAPQGTVSPRPAAGRGAGGEGLN